MIDTFLKSKNITALEELRAFVINVIGPCQGQAATEASTDADGIVTEAQPAKGDPSYHYACIRAPFQIAPYGEVEACDTQEGVDVCGAWS